MLISPSHLAPAPRERCTETGGFVDIHSHILAGLDEGASGIEESLEMLRIAQQDGITAMVATPHMMDGVFPNTRESMESARAELQALSKTMPVYAGAEVRLCADIVRRAASHNLPLINGKRYLLVELPSALLPPMTALEGVVRDLAHRGITVIFSHPERQRVLARDVSLMCRLSSGGALFQVTAMSITRGFGRDVQRATFRMIKQNLVHVVASDSHNMKDRPPVLSEAYEAVQKEFGSDEAWRLFIRNPSGIVNGEDVV